MKKLVHDGYGYHITKKGYPRFNCTGPMKGIYIHRHEAQKMIGRELKKDEEVHHRNFNKRDWSFGNLKILGSKDHGWQSAKQAFYMKLLDVKQEEQFYSVISQLEAEGVKGMDAYV